MELPREATEVMHCFDEVYAVMPEAGRIAGLDKSLLSVPCWCELEGIGVLGSKGGVPVRQVSALARLVNAMGLAQGLGAEVAAHIACSDSRPTYLASHPNLSPALGLPSRRGV